MRLPCRHLLLALGPLAAACHSPPPEPARAALSAPAGADPVDHPSQASWSNATNRAGSAAYRTLAAPVPGLDALQLTWLGPDHLAFMTRASESAPARLYQAARSAGRWSTPLLADLGPVRFHALVDGTALTTGYPMALVAADGSDWSAVLGLGPDGGLGDVLSEEAFHALEIKSRQLFSSLLAGDRWSRALPVPGTRGIVSAALEAGPAGSALALFSRDLDGDLSTTGDRELACALFDGVRWREPRALAGAPGLPMALGIAWAGGAFHLAWAGDQDGDLTTPGDRILYTAAVDASGQVIAPPAALGGPRNRPWPVIGAVQEQPALLFAGDPGPSGARPLLESRFSGGAWLEPRDTQLEVGPLARGRLFDAGAETLLVWEDGDALWSASTAGGAWHTAGPLQDLGAQHLDAVELAPLVSGGAVQVAALVRAAGAPQDAGPAVRLAQLPLGPDLAAATVGATPRALQLGQPAQLQVTVENRGQLRSAPFDVRAADGLQVVASAREERGLWPGERRTYALPVSPARAQTPLDVGVTAVPGDLEPGDDAVRFPLEVLPDFTVQSVEREGDDVVARVVDLKGVATQPVSVDAVLVRGASRETIWQGAWDPNRALPARFTWAGWPAADQPYVISVRVNQRDPVREDDASNDMDDYVRQPSADFVVSRLQVASGQLWVQVANAGDLPAAKVALLITTDPELAASPAPIEGSPPLSLTDVALAGGAGSVSLPAGLLDGTDAPFVYAVVNPYGAVQESNRNNNTARALRSPPRSSRPVFTLLALERAELGPGASVRGSVAVRDEAPGSGDELRLGPEAWVEGDAFAGRIRLQPRAQIAGTAHQNRLALSPGAQVAASASPLALPLDADVPAVSVAAGERDVDAAGEVALPPGRYRDARVAPGGVLQLPGGSYAFRSLRLQPGAGVECAARCQVAVAADLELGARSSLGPAAGSGLGAGGVEVQVMGAGVRLGEGAALRAVAAAPGADLHAGARSSLAGRFIARTVELDQGATVAAEASASAARLEATVLTQPRSPGKE